MKRNAIITLILMIIIVGFLNADQTIMNATLVSIEKEFNVDDASIGIMSALFTVLGAVISIIWGYLSDKKNRKILFSVSIVIAEIPCLLTAFSANYTQFFLLRILTGIGVGVSYPTTFSLLGDLYDEKHRSAAVTWMAAVIGLGQIAGMILGGYMGAVYGWRLPFIAASIPGIIALIFFYLLAPEPKRGASEEALKQLINDGYVYSKTIKLSDYIELAKIKTNLLLFIQGLAGTIPWGAIPLFFVKFMTNNKHFTVSQASTIFLFFGIGTTAGIILGGIWGGRLYKKSPANLPILCSITTFLGALITIFIFLAPWEKNMPLILTLGFSASLVSSITNPNCKTMLLDVNVPENRGAIFSLFNLTDSVGTGFGKFIGGILSVSFGIDKALGISAAMWIPCSILLFVISYLFNKDIKKMGLKLQAAAEQMKLTM